MDRYLKSLRIEMNVRADACAQAADETTAKAWEDWSRGARLWLRDLCLNVSTEPPHPPTKKPPTNKQPTPDKENP